MATWYMVYETLTGRAVSLTTIQAPLDPLHSEANLGEFTFHPYNEGKMWDDLTRTLVNRPPIVLVSRVTDFRNDPLFQDVRDWIQVNVPAARRAELMTLIGTVIRRLMGRERWRASHHAVPIATDDGLADE